MSSRLLRNLALSIILAWGWKRAIIALVAGALSALAMAPFNAWPVLFLTNVLPCQPRLTYSG